MNREYLTVFAISVFTAILFGSLSADIALAAPQPKVTICHVNQETGEEKTITVGAPSVQKHLKNHMGDHEGECIDEPDSCVFNEECSTGEYCAKSIGADPLSEGFCELRPELCPGNFDPVCGIDGISYNNACVAAENGVNISHLGECDGI